MLVPKGHAAVRTIQIRVACAATQGHSAIQAQPAADGHVKVHGPAEAWVCVDVFAHVTTEAHENHVLNHVFNHARVVLNWPHPSMAQR